MKKLFNSKFLFILASSIVVLIGLIIGSFYLFDDMDDLIDSIKEEDFNLEKREEFFKLQFGEFSPDSSKLILDYILED